MRDDRILFEDEGEPLEVFVAPSKSWLYHLVSKRCDYSHTLIITDQSISYNVKTTADRNGWSIAHYSDLPEWLLATFEQSINDRYQGFADEGTLAAY
ncbi:hypothetical protein [Caulobacter rhizosphaerae]|uniref:hypothetical protein n=1 Tax=Caulobacter rhizosphaerae TaxID=2010972 RepID=UPI0013D7F97E|nr:hypothetical protein [Caulobacter rhizosphaerae]GGL20561.1 hypothetical protein GCM10010983_17330 [Caulobacter rhizosphaerae]